MLLSLRNRLTVALCATHIAVVRSGRGWRPLAGKPEIITFEPVADQPGWHMPVAALGSWLQQHQHGAMEVDCILSDRFVRYALIPWSDDIQKPAEIVALARIQFEAIFGMTVADWTITVDCNEYGQAGVACALDKGLLDALHAMAGGNGVRIASVQPYLMRLFNRWRHCVKDEALIAIIEAGHCILATFKGNAWHSIRTLKLESENREFSLQVLVERERLLQGLNAESLSYVHSTEALDRDVLGKKVTVLDSGPSTIEEWADLRMVSMGGN